MEAYKEAVAQCLAEPLGQPLEAIVALLRTPPEPAWGDYALPCFSLAKAWRQLKENHTDACVLNGKAYGAGFAFCTPPADVHELKEKADLVEYLASWLLKKKSP